MFNRQFIRTATLAVCTLMPAVAQNPFDNIQEDRVRQMVKDVGDAMRKHYYDPKFHGVDLEAKIKEADEGIRKAGSSRSSGRSCSAAFTRLNLAP